MRRLKRGRRVGGEPAPPVHLFVAFTRFSLEPLKAVSFQGVVKLHILSDQPSALAESLGNFDLMCTRCVYGTRS
jgi:hypothetical protein